MQTTDQQGRPRLVQSGPNAGQPAPQLYIGVAFHKQDPAWPAYYAELVREAAEGFPQLFPNGPRPDMPNGGCVLPTFAFKIVDGDGFDTTGKSNATKEGFAGHWIVRYTGGFAIKVFRAAGGGHTEITNPADMKRGYFVRVAHTAKANGNAQKPGLYLSPSLVELTAYGEEIISGPSPSEAFAAPAALPPGASPVPLAPAAMPGAAAPLAGAPPAMPPSGAPGGTPGVGAPPPSHTGPGVPPTAYPSSPAPAAYAPPPATAAAPPAYTGFVAAPPAAPMAPPPAPAAPVRQMTAAANGTTYEAYIAAGWTDAQLVQHGLMLA
jgi:hypothetical protein